MITKPAKIEHERRKQARFELTGALPGKVTNSAGQIFEAICVDVSVNGIGLLVDPVPNEGEQLFLETPNGNLTFDVRWVKRQLQLGDLVDELSATCRVGLKLVGATDLIVFLATFDNIQVGD